MVSNPLVTAVNWQFIVCCPGEISREQTPWHPGLAGPGLQGPEGAMLRPTPEPSQNNTELLQLQTPREGAKGKIKPGKMGEKARQRHREGESYGKA